MKISIMCSIDFTPDVLEIQKQLEGAGHQVSLPFTVDKIAKGEMSLEEVLELKRTEMFSDYAKKGDLIRWNYERMQKDDAILVINIEKNGIPNYIGGNTFLEVGFAHILDMKIFLWRGIPDMIYPDEIEAMDPIVIDEDVSKIV